MKEGAGEGGRGQEGERRRRGQGGRRGGGGGKGGAEGEGRRQEGRRGILSLDSTMYFLYAIC